MATKPLLLVADFERLPEPESGRRELDEGEVIELTFPNPRHNRVAYRICRLLDEFVASRNLGIVFPADTGYILGANTLRGPDVSFLRRDRAADIDLRRNIPGAPDLAVEVISEHDTFAAMRRKVGQFLAAGTHTVWVADPEAAEVHVHETGRPPRILTAASQLDCPALLPGFAVTVAELFAID